MREIVHLQAGQCGNQIGAKVSNTSITFYSYCIIHLLMGGIFNRCVS